MDAKFIEIKKGKYTSLEEEINDGIETLLSNLSHSL
jgi:hypothetical protein